MLQSYNIQPHRGNERNVTIFFSANAKKLVGRKSIKNVL
jgi:hypothetical protein